MKNESTAKEMRAAAHKLRESAENATPGPWGTTPQDGVIAWRLGPGGFDDDYEYVIEDRQFEHDEDASWVALVHPGLAQPLAEWLEMEAHMVEKRGLSAEGNTFHALKVARAINGTAE
jgi:hypothetical protein